MTEAAHTTSLASRLAAVLDGCPPLTEAGREWVARRLAAHGLHERARNFGGLRCHAPHEHGSDDRCVRVGVAWIRIYPSEAEGLRRLVTLGNLATLTANVRELAPPVAPGAPPSVPGAPHEGTALDELALRRVLARGGIYLARPGAELPKGAHELEPRAAADLVRPELLARGDRPFLYRPPTSSTPAVMAAQRVAQYRELARAWGPVLAWFGLANARCPCKAIVAPLVGAWREFAARAQTPNAAIDSADLARHLCSLREAVATIQKFAARSSADHGTEIDEDPQWAPVREAIAKMPPGACAVLPAPPAGDLGGYRSIDPDHAAEGAGDELGDGLERHAAGLLVPWISPQPTQAYDLPPEEVQAYLGDLGDLPRSPAYEAAQGAHARLGELLDAKPGGRPRWFRGSFIVGTDAHGYRIAIWTKRDRGYRPDIDFPVTMLEGNAPRPLCAAWDYLGPALPADVPADVLGAALGATTVDDGPTTFQPVVLGAPQPAPSPGPTVATSGGALPQPFHPAPGGIPAAALAWDPIVAAVAEQNKMCPARGTCSALETPTDGVRRYIASAAQRAIFAIRGSDPTPPGFVELSRGDIVRFASSIYQLAPAAKLIWHTETRKQFGGGVSGDDLGGFFDAVNPFAPSAEAEAKVQEVAAVWAGLEPKIQANPAVAAAVKPQRDFWLQFYKKWRGGDRDENAIRAVIADANAARSNALGAEQKKFVSLADTPKVADIESEKLTAARGAAQSVDDRANALGLTPGREKWIIGGIVGVLLLFLLSTLRGFLPRGRA